MRWSTAAALDLCCVLAFVVLGRASHAEALTPGGVVSTGWPFLVGAAAGWAATRAWRRPAAVVPAGLGIWIGTVGVGMFVRAIAGQGTAGAFVIVASIFLAVTILGWRAVTGLVARTRRVPERD